MSPDHRQGSPSSLRFPRVSGDEPWTLDAYTEMAVFSPRERG